MTKNALNKLIEGHQTFQTDIYPRYSELLHDLAAEQKPRVLLITCSDSRIVPSLLLDFDPGEVFVCRTAGNIVPPYEDEACQQADGVSATLEYAIEALGIHEIIVLGHSDCGAMKGVLKPELVQKLPATARWLKHAEPALRVVGDPKSGPFHEHVNRMAQENVIMQVANLRTHPSVAAGIQAGTIRMHGWYLDIPTGAFLRFDVPRRAFLPLSWGELGETESDSFEEGAAA